MTDHAKCPDCGTIIKMKVKQPEKFKFSINWTFLF